MKLVRLQVVYRSFQLINSLLSNTVLIANSGNVDIAVTTDSASNPNIAILLVNYNWYNLTIADETVTVSLKGLSCVVSDMPLLIRVCMW